MASLVYQAFREFFPHHTQEKVESKKNSELNFVGYTFILEENYQTLKNAIT